MKFVEPIKDLSKIAALKEILRATPEYGLRDEAIFVTGINTALRVSDLLKLTGAGGSALRRQRRAFPEPRPRLADFEHRRRKDWVKMHRYPYPAQDVRLSHVQKVQREHCPCTEAAQSLLERGHFEIHWD